jgi:Fe-S cluster assembly scaffold protein SufB
MNKILVIENKIIPFDDSNVIIENNTIKFYNNGNYYIEYIDCNDISINIELKENVCINLFEYSNNKDINIDNKYNLCKNSSLIVSKFYANDNTNERVNIYLKGNKANIKYNFSSVSGGSDKYTINIYHESNNTSSDIFNRTVAKKGSSNIFDINSYIDNGIKDCYLNQQTKIITLGDSNNKINPNMFIGEETTTAVHSSVIGSINKEDLFYMMSRGIDYNASINLIVKGMILSNINVNMEYKEKILKILDYLGGE